jgi:hypothetical protein
MDVLREHPWFYGYEYGSTMYLENIHDSTDGMSPLDEELSGYNTINLTVDRSG